MNEIQNLDRDRLVPVSDLGQWYRHGPYRSNALGIKETILSTGEPITLVRARHSAGQVNHPPCESYTLLTMVQGTPESACDLGAGTFDAQPRPGDLLLAPPGVAVSGTNSAPLEICAMSIPVSVMERLQATRRDGKRTDLTPLQTRVHQDTLISRVIMSLWQNSDTLAGVSAAYLEAGVNLVVARLLMLAQGDAGAASAAGYGAEVGGRLHDVIDHIRHNPGASLTLEELAKIAQCSPFHLARVFKQQVGQTVHQYVLEQRIDRAKEYLADANRSIANIARETGFSSQSHLTAAFRRHVGITPGAFRKATLT